MRRISINPKNIELLFELGCLRFLPRTGSQFLHADFGNIAEHHFRVSWIALLLAEMEGNRNTGKIIKMALAHDIAESRTGDVNYLQRQYVVRNETLAITDILSGTLVEKEFIELLKDYESRKSEEAKIVKDADSLDVDLSLKEQEAQGFLLSRNWYAHRKKIVRKTLYTKSAKIIFDIIWKANPNDWHLNGRNRINGGDWKKPRRK